MTGATLLRVSAIGIAVLGAVDPAITSERPVRPTIAVIDTTSVDTNDVTAAQVVRDVRARLSSAYRVAGAEATDAAATVVVGDRLPPPATLAASGPAFGVSVDRTGPAVTIVRTRAPRRASIDARVPVDVSLHATQAAGQTLVVTVETDHVAVDRIEQRIASADEWINATLHVPPGRTGVAVARVTASLGPSARSSADVAVEIEDAPWTVLVFDRRPAWMSTFVRRALERDARFSVKSRTVTSNGAATDRGQPPAGLGDEAALANFDVILVGAPDALSRGDVSGLEAFARKRGGSIVLLVDQAVTGPGALLIDVAQWKTVTPLDPVSTAARTADPGLTGTEFITPARLPAGARVRATLSLAGPPPVVVFERPIGAGRAIVSGAADAWRYRGAPGTSPFERFWRDLVADAASSAPPAIAVEPATTALEPGQTTSVVVTTRDAVLATGSTRGETIGLAVTDAAGSSRPIRLWPDGAPGRYRGEFDAPAQVGRYELVAASGSERGRAAVLVRSDLRSARADDRHLVRGWVASRGGEMFDATRLADLDRAIARTLHPEHRRERWWPMRSGWWIAPFAALLGGEWWRRRRRDLR